MGSDLKSLARLAGYLLLLGFAVLVAGTVLDQIKRKAIG